MTYDTIWRCGGGSLLDYECPEQWDSLEVTELPSVRFCSVCKQNVHLCQRPEEFVALARKKECVAIPTSLHIPDSARAGQLMLGRPPPWSYVLERKAKAWWKIVEMLEGDLGRQFYDEMNNLRIRRDKKK